MELAEFINSQRLELAAVGSDVGVLVDLVSTFTAGGKRIRPVLAWWGWRAAGGDDTNSMIKAAASLELIQACALIHDDVMDGSDTRRGLPAMHRQLEAMHHEGGWRGDSAGFGAAGAILLGDLCLSWADQLLFASGLTSEAVLRAKPLFDVMRTELMAGQYLDVLEQARGTASPAAALQVARYKSAKYTIERPLQIGVTLAGGDAGLLDAMSGYGLPLGEAFQLRDDVLGVFGDPAITGKPAGDDLREGKQTYLVACALETASPADQAFLLDNLGRPDIDAKTVDDLRGIISSSGASERTENLIASDTEAAIGALDRVEIRNGAADVLRALAIAATRRSH